MDLSDDDTPEQRKHVVKIREAGTRKMNEHIIERWNAVVGRKDTVFVLGDLCYVPRSKNTKDYLRELEARLNGTIFLVPGNHDRKETRNYFRGHGRLKELYCNVKVEGQRITLCHFAMRVWPGSHFGTWQLYGHSHGELPESEEYPLQMEVGVDAHNFRPVPFEEVSAFLELKRARIGNYVGDPRFVGGLVQPELFKYADEEAWERANSSENRKQAY